MTKFGTVTLRTARFRNRMIGRVFVECGYFEQWGSGVKRMVDACAAAGKPGPVIDELPGRIRVTFSFEQSEVMVLSERKLVLVEHIG